MNKLLAAALAALTLSSAAAGKGKKPPARQETKTMEWNGQQVKSGEPAALVIKTAAEWASLWEKIGQPAPPADWTKHFAAAVILDQKMTGGYKVVFLEPRIDKKASTFTVSYRVREPDGMSIQVLTRPYAVKLFPATQLTTLIEAAPE